MVKKGMKKIVLGNTKYMTTKMVMIEVWRLFCVLLGGEERYEYGVLKFLRRSPRVVLLDFNTGFCIAILRLRSGREDEEYEKRSLSYIGQLPRITVSDLGTAFFTAFLEGEIILGYFVTVFFISMILTL